MNSRCAAAAISGFLTGGLLLGGCALNNAPEPLVPSQFVRGHRVVGQDGIGQPIGQSGALTYGELHSPLLPDERPAPPSPPPTPISSAVRNAIPAPGEGAGADVKTSAAQSPLSSPTTEPATAVTGGYQVVGTVLAKVDKTPIYADKVLAALEHELAADARKYDTEAFRRVARSEIESKIQELIHTQLEIERASTSLNKEAKTQAEMYAQVWRKQQITAAGGSVELAKRRALEAGSPLDDQVREQYQSALVQIYYQERVAPRIQVSANDMRKYYQAHLATEFTHHAEARFRLIRIDFTRSGGPEQAAAKADQLIAKLKGGASFEELAKSYNDDSSLMAKGGDVGWMHKGDYRYDKIEQAVWALQPGEYTDKPIEVTDEVRGTAYYLAQLDARKTGAVQAFDDAGVQTQIHEKLFSQQLAGFREKEIADLVNQAVIFRGPTGLETAVDMAMQRYSMWASAK